MSDKLFILAYKHIEGDMIRSVHNGKASSGVAIMCGTWAHCARYQLAHGIRLTTEIIEV